jgi:dienelactone hydrolase
MKILTPLLIAACMLTHAQAKLVEKTVIYTHAGVSLEGYHVYDDATTGPRPGILVAHQWTGLSEHEKSHSRKLAQAGYNVLAADIYGQGIRPQAPEAGKEAGKYKADRPLLRARLLAGLEVLKADAQTNPSQLAAIGYCFGGTAVLELARAGTPLAGVVSFHGGLDAAPELAAQAGKIPAKLLVLHGAVDPYVPAEQVADFQKEMTTAKADWQMISYGGAVHSFTHPEAGDDPSKGAAYHAAAARRSWTAMLGFFNEIFQRPDGLPGAR